MRGVEADCGGIEMLEDVSFVLREAKMAKERCCQLMADLRPWRLDPVQQVG